MTRPKTVFRDSASTEQKESDLPGDGGLLDAEWEAFDPSGSVDWDGKTDFGAPVKSGASPTRQLLSNLLGPVALAGVRSVIGNDDRTEIHQTDRRPWSMICDLDVQGSNGEWGRGTGWLASPRTVITAAHCVEHHSLGGWAERVKVRPGRSHDEEPFGVQESSQFSITVDWHERRDPLFDFAAIHLPGSFSRSPGFFRFGPMRDLEIIDLPVNVSGYPGKKSRRSLWTHRDRIIHLEDQLLEYENDSSVGQSGSPVFLFPDGPSGQPRVIGIHAYGVHDRRLGNSAPRINPLVARYLHSWIAQSHNP